MENFDFTAFRNNLRRLIDVRGVSIKRFAEEVNMTAATLSRYLSGDRNPELKYIIHLAQYFDVSVDWLIGLSGDRYDIMPQNLQDIADLYSVASPDDKQVVQTVLRKYKLDCTDQNVQCTDQNAQEGTNQ